MMHRSFGHIIGKCRNLKDHIDQLILAEYMKEFVLCPDGDGGRYRCRFPKKCTRRVGETSLDHKRHLQEILSTNSAAAKSRKLRYQNISFFAIRFVGVVLIKMI
jgi:hypothetical protein